MVTTMEAQKVLDAISTSGKKSTKPIHFEIPAPGTVQTTLKVKSLPGSSLIVCAISRDTREDMESTDTVKIKRPKLPPEESALSKCHLFGSGTHPKFCFPVSGIYQGMINLPQEIYDKVLSKKLMRSINFIGDLTADKSEIVFESKNLRTDYAKNGRYTFPTYRYEFINWEMKFTITFDRNVISLEQLQYLISQAGYYNGIGSWSPHTKKGGSHGLYFIPPQETVLYPISYLSSDARKSSVPASTVMAVPARRRGRPPKVH